MIALVLGLPVTLAAVLVAVILSLTGSRPASPAAGPAQVSQAASNPNVASGDHAGPRGRQRGGAARQLGSVSLIRSGRERAQSSDTRRGRLSLPVRARPLTLK